MALLPLGTVLGGRYRLVRFLDRGGMGNVYEAEDEQASPAQGQEPSGQPATSVARSPRRVAIKLVRQIEGDRMKRRERFLQEIALSQEIHHENFVRVLSSGFDEEQSLPFLVMELLQGQNLEAFLKAHGALSPPAAVRLARQALAGLSAIHDRGLIHRDIKPANLFLHEGEGEGSLRLVICDLGIAKDTQETESEGQTSTGVIVGSARYLSPEQARKVKDLDARTDLFSLAATLYEMLCGQGIWHEHSINEEIVAALLRDPVPALRSRAPSVPETLAEVVHKGLEKDRLRRHPSAHELDAALAPFDTLSALPSKIQGLTEFCRNEPHSSAAAAPVIAQASTASLASPTTTLELSRPGLSRWLAVPAALGAVLLFWFQQRSAATPTAALAAAPVVSAALGAGAATPSVPPTAEASSQDQGPPSALPSASSPLAPSAAVPSLSSKGARPRPPAPGAALPASAAAAATTQVPPTPPVSSDFGGHQRWK